jgi:hypothetical protein
MFPILMPIISMILSVRVVLAVLIWKSFFGLLRSNHPFHCVLEFFVASWVLFVEILELPLGWNFVGESFNDLPFSDVMYLSTQLTEPSVIISETFASFFLESFQFRMSDRVCDDAYEIITEGSLQVFPAPD